MAKDREEKDEKYEGEEGEYQFSDEQISYDQEAEPETVKAAEPAASPTIGLMTRLMPYRRMLIAVFVFFILIFIIYKMLSPATTTPPTEFSQAAPPKPTEAAPPQQAQPVSPPAAPQVAEQPVAQPVAPIAAPTMPPPAPVPSIATAQPPPPAVAPQPAVTPTPPASPVAVAPTPTPTPAPTMVTPTPTTTITQTTIPANSYTGSAELVAEQKNILDKLTSLEEQNAKMMNLLQSEFSQKMAQYDAQNNATQQHVDMLGKRLMNMEMSMNKMAQMIRTEGPPPPPPAQPPPMAVNMAPPPPPVTVMTKTVYTVQAIIPGRAWLKSDMGDTITVAEGDVLKGLGRVTKIDPYDGVVEINTGTKIIDLSYGSVGDG